MKKVICVVLAFILSVATFTVCVSADTMYTCPTCHTDNVAIRVCGGSEITGQKEVYDCPYRNQSLLGALHLGDCFIERHYCNTAYYCTACYRTTPTSESHMCWVIHTSVNENGVHKPLYTSVCSTYLNMKISQYAANVGRIATYPGINAYYDMMIAGDTFQ